MKVNEQRQWLHFKIEPQNATPIVSRLEVAHDGNCFSQTNQQEIPVPYCPEMSLCFSHADTHHPITVQHNRSEEHTSELQSQR